MRKKLKLNRQDCQMLLLVVLFNYLAYYSGRFIAQDFIHYNFTTKIDQIIPLVPWTILIYWGCYLFWAINYIISIKYDKVGKYCFLKAHIIGELICFLCFVFLPTTMTRGNISSTQTISNTLLRMTYVMDAADNLFPSIHCYASWLCFIGVRNHPKIPKWYQYLSLGIALAICISTLTVKQHVLLDVFAGILVAEFAYLVAVKLTKKNLN